LFIAHPHLRQKWIFAKDLATEMEMRENSQLAYHALKIAQLFSKLIMDINNINTLDLSYVVNLGRNHQTYGVRPEDFEVNILFFELS
jgi:hypothetical protein